MEDLVSRFIRYIAIDTQSSEESGTHPSSNSQIEFGNVLVNDLKELGITNIIHDEFGYIYVFIDNNKDKTIGLISHMDTAPDFVGGINEPKIIENYDGNDILLDDSAKLSIEEFPFMKNLIGDKLIVTDGKHLLGGDDKAGIVIIFEFLKYFLTHKEEFRYNLSICFTVDEEIGEGPLNFDLKKMNADIAFTLDGGTIYEANSECFNAASCTIEIQGVSVHPGDAKDIMVNAALVGTYYANLLPLNETPANTSDYEGFIHLTSFKGDVENAKLTYILRDHDLNLLEEKKKLMLKTKEIALKTFPKAVISINFKDEYRNMISYFIKDPRALQMINNAYLKQKIKLKYTPIRGGTDGATITEMGLPCPNLGVGDFNPHGKFEFVSVTQMEKMVEIIKEIFKGTIL